MHQRIMRAKKSTPVFNFNTKAPKQLIKIIDKVSCNTELIQ